MYEERYELYEDEPECEKTCCMCEYYAEHPMSGGYGQCTAGHEDTLHEQHGCGINMMIMVRHDNKACEMFEWNDKAKTEEIERERDEATFESEHARGAM